MAPTALKLKEMLLAGVPCLVNVPPSWAGWPLSASVGGLSEVTAETVCARMLEIAQQREQERLRLDAARAVIEAEYDWTSVTGRYAGALAEFCGISAGDRAGVTAVPVPA